MPTDATIELELFGAPRAFVQAFGTKQWVWTLPGQQRVWLNDMGGRWLLSGLGAQGQGGTREEAARAWERAALPLVEALNPAKARAAGEISPVRAYCFDAACACWCHFQPQSRLHAKGCAGTATDPAPEPEGNGG